ncbi:hypothetical protein [Gorillibacterium sp. CAU 1737]|uniref:hypothetical protein n=1 Tax=Gorillibacterium sp. CAU 1737 TaxID=3140362 RepID=UPI003260D415
MKITNSQPGGVQGAGQEMPLELRKGETYPAIVKERKSSTEAIVQIRGKEVAVKTDGLFPASGESVSLTIQGQEAGAVKVSVASAGRGNASSTGAAAPSSSTASTDLYTADNGQVTKLLADKGIPLTRETVGEIQRFMESAPGTVEEKLDSLRALLGKGIEVTEEQLQAVHQALHGDPLATKLDRVLAAAGGNETPDVELQRLVGELRKLTSGSPEWQQLLNQLTQKLQNSSGGNGSRTTADTLSAAIRLLRGGQSEQAGELLRGLLQEGGAKGAASGSTGSTPIDQLLEIAEKEPNVSRLLYEIKDRLLAGNAVTDGERKRWDDTFSAVRREQLAGRSEEARSLLKQALRAEQRVSMPAAASSASTATAQALPASSDSTREADALDRLASSMTQAMSETGAYDWNSELASLGLSTKTLVVTQVTARLSQAANEFRSLKREVSRNLDNILSLTQAGSRAVLPQAKAILESSIDLLDKAILKSDLTLLTDMGTEKRLLTASSQLAAARKQLVAGDFAGARDLFQQVKSNLETLNWKPADVKVRHLLMGETDSRPDVHRLSAEWEKVTSALGRNEGSARGTYEAIRSLGLNRDSETAQWLASSNGNSSGQSQGQPQSRSSLDANIKSILLRLAQEDSPVAKQAGEALQSLTGQQLLSKAEPGSPVQSMMLQLPVPLANQIAPLNVFVQARKEGEKMDWENCSLYFALETKKLGSLGIQITASERTLSITVKNDRTDLRQRMEPLVQSCRDKLQEIGYRVSQVQFASLTPATADEPVEGELPVSPEKARSPLTSSAKGFDFKV